MEGLIGLQNNIKTTESAIRDLSVLERMDARIQKDKDAEMVAQQQEQLLYEKAFQMSDQLLEKDRNKINSRFKMAQNQISNHIRESGGSKRMFMEEGGLSVINNITNDVMRSPEAVRYNENKQNLAKIYEAQMKGLGHLISPKDLKSLEDYQNSEEGGQITFSGMLAEVKIPPSENFDYGTDIPYEKIMSYDSNMIRIRQNFETVHPDKEFTYPNVVAFMREMGYGGQGSNTVAMRLDAQKAAAIARANKTKPTDNPNTILGNWSLFTQQLDSALPGGITLQGIEKLKSEKGVGLIEHLKSGENPTANKLLGEKSNIIEQKRTLSEKGPDITDIIPDKLVEGTDWIFQEKYKLKESYEFLPLSTGTIVNRVLGKDGDAGLGYEIVDGKVKNFVPDENMFRTDGVQLTGSNKIDPDDHKGDYVIKGVVTGLKGTDQDKQSVLLMDAYDRDEKTIDKDKTAQINEGYRGKEGGDELEFTTLIALQNEKTGNLFYKEVNINRPDIKRALSVAMGEDDDIKGQVNEENEKFMAAASIDKIQKDELIRMKGTINRANEEVFQDPLFEQEGEKYWGSYSAGQENRYPLMKSFYMAFDTVARSEQQDEPVEYDKQSLQGLVDNNFFTNAAIHGNIEEKLKTYDGTNDLRIIQEWLKNINETTETELGRSRNETIASKWAQIHNLIGQTQ